MTIIDARIDNIPTYPKGSARGAIAKYIIEMNQGESLTVNCAFNAYGEVFGHKDIQCHIDNIAKAYGAKYHVYANGVFSNIYCVTGATKKGYDKKDDRKITPIKVVSKYDNHSSYRKYSTRGAVAQHLFKLKVGESVKILSVVDAHNNKIEMQEVRAHISAIGKHNKAKFIGALDKGKLVVTMVALPEKMRTIKLKDHKKSSTKKPGASTYNRVETPAKEKIEISSVLANKFILGGFSNVPANQSN